MIWEQGCHATLAKESYTHTSNGDAVVFWYTDNSGTLGSKLDEAPSDAGTYWVQVATPATGLYQAASAQKSFIIEKAQLFGPKNIEVVCPFPDKIDTTWSSVEYATGYNVTLVRDNERLEGSDYKKYVPSGGNRCEFDITQPGNYRIEIYTVPDANHVGGHEISDSDGLEYYQIDYDFNGGTNNSPGFSYPQYVAHGYTADKPARNPTREDYAFVGWYAEGANEPWDFDNDTISGPTKFSAQWGRYATPVDPIEDDTVRYLIQHYQQKPGGSDDWVLAEEEAPVGKLNETVQAQPKSYEGYTYNSSVSLAEGTLKEISGEADLVILKLYYDLSTYSVTLDVGEGIIADGQMVTDYTYSVGASLPTDVTREGFEFAGWYDNPDYNGDPVTAIGITETGNKTFYAKWVSLPEEGSGGIDENPDEQSSSSASDDVANGSAGATTPDTSDHTKGFNVTVFGITGIAAIVIVISGILSCRHRYGK